MKTNLKVKTTTEVITVKVETAFTSTVPQKIYFFVFYRIVTAKSML